MFYKNSLNAKKVKKEKFEFNMFALGQNHDQDKTMLDVGEGALGYNFITEDGTIKNGYGFKTFAMPENYDDLDSEADVGIRGNEVQTMWKLHWYNSSADQNVYYLFYYNNENYLCYDDMFIKRYSPLIWPTNFTELPYITSYRNDKRDAMLLSGKDGTNLILTGGGYEQVTTGKAIVSCCSHYGKLFAITASARGTLVYSTSTDITNWDDTLTKDLDFSDERGDMNKIISFNDYLYIFRDFGITKVSQYGSDDLLAVSHMYKANAYIHPNTVCECGENVYFLEGNKLKSFNGSSVKDLPLSCLKLLKGKDNRWAYAECFEGKYFLACKGDFKDGKSVGCESGTFNNNILIVYDILSGHEDIVRGVDIHELLAFTNPYKSKLLACFYGEDKAKIGELSLDGKIFENKLSSMWKSGQTDFGFSGEEKRITSFCIKTKCDCLITFTSENGRRSYNVKADENLQKVETSVRGLMFEVEIESASIGDDYISSFVVTVEK